MPYLRGTATSVSQARRPPTPTVLTTTSAPGSSSHRSPDAVTVIAAPRDSIIRRLSPSAVSSAMGSISHKASSHGPSSGSRIRSATRPRVKTALPAPISRIFFMVFPLVLVALLPISHIQQRSTVEKPPQVLRKNTHHALVVVGRKAGDVGGDQNIWHRPERMIGGQWFLLEDIQCCTCDPTFPECRDQGGFIDHAAPGDVDQHG